jgi:hypothetical protein
MAEDPFIFVAWLFPFFSFYILFIKLHELSACTDCDNIHVRYTKAKREYSEGHKEQSKIGLYGSTMKNCFDN